MAELTITETPPVSTPFVPPYPPSWVNRVIAAIHRAPVPAWAIYGGLAALCVGLEVGVKWLDGTYPAGFLPFHLVIALWAMFYLPLMDYLDGVAAHVLKTAWPVLMVNADTYQVLRYRLTTLPAGPTLAWAVVGLLTDCLLYFTQPGSILGQLHMQTSPLASVVDVTLGAFGWAGASILAYHTFYQLRLVNEIYTHHTRVSLFALGPLYAFSRLTARTALLIIGVAAIVGAAIPGLVELPEYLLVGAFAFVLAGVTFVAPLWNVHQLLAQEKAAHQDGLARRLEAATHALKEAVDHNELAKMGDLKTALEALVMARKELDAISTWPWQPETLRTVVTALLAPLLLWLIARLVERFGLF